MRKGLASHPALVSSSGLALLVSACASEGPLHTHVGDWRDEVIYQLVTDRFANGDPENDTIDGIGPIPGDFSRFQGGDWRGVEAHLDSFFAG